MSKRELPASRVQHRQLLELQKAGVYTRDDPQGKINVFREYQKYGLLPTEFDTPNQLTDAMQELIQSGLSKKEAMSVLGVNVDIFNADGSINGRGIRDAHSPGLKDLIDTRSGEGTTDNLAALERRGWRAAQLENRDIAQSLGMKINAGHYDTSASGAPASNRAAGTESAVINQMNGRSAENPARPLTASETENLGVANTKALGLYEAALEQSGLPARSGTAYPLNPYVSALVGSDQATRYIPDNQLEVFNRTFQDLVEQGYNEVAMYDHVKAGGTLDAKALAQAGSEKRGISTFVAAAPETTAPVKQVRPPDRKLTVVPYRTPQIQSPSVTRGRVAAAIATREPIPNPPKLSKGGLALAALGVGAYMAAGESPANAMALATLDNTIGSIESTNTAPGLSIRRGGFTIDNSNRILNHTNRTIENLTRNLGLAIKNGKPVPVPYGSVAPGGFGRAERARQRGSRTTLSVGPLKFQLPELGISEALRINK